MGPRERVEAVEGTLTAAPTDEGGWRVTASCVELSRRLRPDVCLADIGMPALDGLDATRALAGPGIHTPMRVVVIAGCSQISKASPRAAAPTGVPCPPSRRTWPDIQQKIDARNRVEIAAWAWESGVVRER